MNDAKPKPRLSTFTLIALTCLAVFISAWSTRNGVGFAGDSTAYISAARSFAKTGKMLVPNEMGGIEVMSSWPPLYPEIVAMLSRIFGDALPAARWLGVIIFPLNVLLLAGVARRTNVSPNWTVFICVLFTTAPSIMEAHVLAMSDALFVTFWLSSWVLVLEYRRHPTLWLLAVAGLGAALALLCRYIGIATTGALALYVCLCTPGGWLRRLSSATVYMLLAVAPLALWLKDIRGTAVLTKLSGVELAHGSVLHSWLVPLISSVLRWSLPLFGYDALKAIFAGVLAIGLVAWAVFFFKNGGGAQLRLAPIMSGDRPEIAILFSMILCEAMLVLNKLFRDPGTELTERLEIPLFVCLLLAFSYLATVSTHLFMEQRHAFARRSSLAMLGVLLGAYLFSAAVWIWQADEQHLEWSSQEWRDSPARGWLARVPSATVIYTNFPNPTYYFTGRTDLVRLPDTDVGVNGQHNPDYTQEVARVVAQAIKAQSVIVIFNVDSTRFATSAQLKQVPGLEVRLETPDVTIFQGSGHQG